MRLCTDTRPGASIVMRVDEAHVRSRTTLARKRGWIFVAIGSGSGLGIAVDRANGFGPPCRSAFAIDVKDRRLTVTLCCLDMLGGLWMLRATDNDVLWLTNRRFVEEFP